ncbi:MAG: TIM barrel protein, partial [Planctomycetota bacterium]
VNSEHWRSPLSDPDPAVRARGRQTLEQALRDAKSYGSTTVLLVPAVVNKQVSYADAWKRSRAEIRRVLPLAEEVRVRWATSSAMAGLISGYASSTVAFSSSTSRSTAG